MRQCNNATMKKTLSHYIIIALKTFSHSKFTHYIMNRRSALKNISIGVGITVSSGTLLSLISSCKSESSTTSTSSAGAGFLNQKNAGFVEELMDIMLPATDTPGAKDVGIIRYVNVVLDKLYEKNDQKVFNKGLGFFQDAVKKKFNLGSGLDVNREQLTEVLDDWIGTKNESRKEEIGGLLYADESDVAAKDKENFYIYKFLNNVKYLATSAYFGSEEIATKHLNYDPVPGKYIGCIPVEEVGNNWAL